MKKNLLLEGAVAGHMNHIYDNGEMTFAELKQLLSDAAEGRLRGTEKTDGQNIYLSFNPKTNRAIGIRNKTMIAAGGFNSDKMDVWFSDHVSQAIRYSFVEAIKEFEKMIISLNLDEGTKVEIFGPGAEYDYDLEDVKRYTQWQKLYKEKRKSIKDPKGAAKKAREMTEKEMGSAPALMSQGRLFYYNTEVMNPGDPNVSKEDPRGRGTTNVIPYDKKTLLFHRVGHHEFQTSLSGIEEIEDTEDNTEAAFRSLENLLVDKGTDDPSTFSVETNPIRELPPIKNKDILTSTLSKIQNIMSDMRMRPSSTINQYVIAQLGPQIDRLDISDEIKDFVLLRVMGIEDEETKSVPRLTDIVRNMPEEMKSKVNDFVKNFSYSSYTSSLELALHDFSVAMIDGLDSSFIADNDNAIFQLRRMATDYKSAVENSSNDEAKVGLKKQWDKLKHIRNINTPSEGFVFNFKGTTYKFTGAFAPLNQIIGIRKYGRYGPIDDQGPGSEDALGSSSQALGAEDKTLAIALLPGSFKPPHIGHLYLLEQISNLKEEGIIADRSLVIISRPLKKQRTLPISGRSITADQALQCWHVFLEGSSIKNAEVEIGSMASPMPQTEEFVTLAPDPENKFIAPLNATIILGVGDKGDDAARYASIVQKAKKLRPDLKIIEKVVQPLTHMDRGGEYMSFVKQNPEIAKGLKENDQDQFHASDMRYLMDIAEKDPMGIEMLKDFVPRADDVLAVLGICGINPVDDARSEVDQVKEPELDQLSEMLKQHVDLFFEGFKRQKTPRGEKSKSNFQRRMRKRLSKAHRTYLDMGRRDLTKHGGGFHLDRPKDISNAFLAEEEIEEISTMGGSMGPNGEAPSQGNVEGYSGPLGKIKKRKRTNIMQKEEKKQQRKLRLKIREGLKKFFAIKSDEHEQSVAKILEEHKLRIHLREVILEQSLNEVEDPSTDIHDSTGINTLKDLLKNTNVLATLREIYKTLTTNEEQKNSFRAHIIQWVQDTLAPVKLNDTDGIDSPEAKALAEKMGIDIENVDASKFIDAPDGSEKDDALKSQPEDDDELSKIEGEDSTGRNKAERVYPAIEKSIVDYYAELDNPEDQEMFFDYLIANLKLYFDKWDSEMQKGIEEPTNQEYEQAKDVEQVPGLSAAAV